jgi:two-component system cell cycle sensor histidine kinase/response regulator CckA
VTTPAAGLNTILTVCQNVTTAVSGGGKKVEMKYTDDLPGSVRYANRGMKKEAELQRIKQLESLGLVAAGIAHDFNNLLQGIVGNISLARTHLEQTAAAHKLLGDAEEICMTAKKLTDNLLTFSKGGSPSKTIFNINERIEDWVRPILGCSNISCDLRLPGECRHIEIGRAHV